MEQSRKDIRTILFISSGNAIRSPMAEGFVNSLFPDRYRAASAGTAPREIDPMTVTVMKEAGIDLSSHRPLRAGDISGVQADFVVTLCDQAKNVCPLFSCSSIAFHKAFEEPAPSPADSEAKRERYRHLRDEIRGWVETTFG